MNRLGIAVLALLVVVLLPSCLSTDSDGDFVGSWDSVVSGSHDKAHQDWPVSIVFRRGANFTNVGKALRDAGGGEQSGSPGTMYLGGHQDGVDWEDASSGEKNKGAKRCEKSYYGFNVSQHDWLHARYYGKPSTGSSSSDYKFGKFVVATTHFDVAEQCPKEMFGWPELAEFAWIYNLWCSGYDAHYGDFIAVPETETGRARGRKYVWDADGFASVVNMSSKVARRCPNAQFTP